MNIVFQFPWLLALCPLVVVPWISQFLPERLASWNQLVVRSDSSKRLDVLLRLTGSVALLCLLIALAGPQQIERKLQRIGTGAHIVFVLDRSASMDETFGGWMAGDDEKSKGAVAQELLSSFIDERPHDMFAVTAFSTQPIFVTPLTENRTITQAAINTMLSPGLAFTNVPKGLAMGLSLFRDQPVTGSRVIVLVSDGAASLDHRAQRTLREWFERYQVRLYWFFLRTENGMGITTVPNSPREDNPRVMPERYLDMFFRTLSTPYQAYEIDTPESLQAAIDQLDELENRPLLYQEIIPRSDLSDIFYLIALFCVFLLSLVKALEAK
ncbi:MxaC protein [Methylophaga lonarensis MPL]|uniref:MxaC protein n=1 Tax=Methylophaga lonarensis MPL TaxID=1286106 RepID=M7PEU0_9GAMM|nr:VWA domain-containing protein [Methylophaga lonarensis]EMR12405.1 MxaC protein [Methylophaga lonarensis MPL]